jgi:hypothetical protein
VGLAQQLPREDDPARVWERVFGLAQSTDPLLAARGSVLDYALADYEALKPKLGTADRQRLDQHFELVRQLESRISGLASAECNAPNVPLSQEHYDANFKSFVDLVSASFSCDLTRVATLSLGDIPSADFGWGDYLSGDTHNDFAHHVYDDPQANMAMSDYHRFHSEQMAYLISTLENIPDGQGQSLMDNTLIVWGGEMADGWHGYEKYFMMLAGGSWAFQPGRYLHYPWGSTPIDLMLPFGSFTQSGLPHHHVLVSVAQAMGLDVNQVGLHQLESRTGARVNLQGPLEGLT